MDIRGCLVTSCHQENRWYPLLCTARVTHQLSKLPSGYGLDCCVLASAMHGISLNGFSSLTTFFSHFSVLALSAVALPYKATFLQHSTRQRPGRRKGREMLNTFTSRCYKPVSDRLFISAGLSWRCLDAFIWLDIHPSNNRPCIPEKARDRHIILWCYF